MRLMWAHAGHYDAVSSPWERMKAPGKCGTGESVRQQVVGWHHFTERQLAGRVVAHSGCLQRVRAMTAHSTLGVHFSMHLAGNQRQRRRSARRTKVIRWSAQHRGEVHDGNTRGPAREPFMKCSQRCLEIVFKGLTFNLGSHDDGLFQVCSMVRLMVTLCVHCDVSGLSCLDDDGLFQVCSTVRLLVTLCVHV